MELLIDIGTIGVIACVTWFLANEGPWTTILTFFAVVFAGLIAMNFFEPLADLLAARASSLSSRADFISFVVLFGLFVFLIRQGLDQVAPTNIEFPQPVYQAVRWGGAFATGYVTMAILLTSLHTSPLPRKFAGFVPERPNFLGVSAPDVQWLGFTQYVTEHVFARRLSVRNVSGNIEDMTKCFDGMTQLFPGKQRSDYLATFILRYATRRAVLNGQAKPAAPVAPVSGGAPGAAPSF